MGIYDMAVRTTLHNNISLWLVSAVVSWPSWCFTTL